MYSSNKLTVFAIITFSLIKTMLFAQDIDAIKSKYPGHSELILRESQKYQISVKKNKPVITQENYYESIILSENGIHNNSESFSFSELVPLINFDAYTLVKINGKEKKIPIGQVTDKGSTDNSIFFSDVKHKKLFFDNLQVGAKKVFSYESEFLDPYLLHSFSFSENLPIEESKLEIITDDDIEIGFKLFNDDENLIKHTAEKKKGKHIYKWIKNNCEAFKFEENHPGFLHSAPHLVIFIKSYKGEKSTIPVLGNIDLLYKYYQGFTKGINQKEDQALKEISLNLTNHLSSDEEKIKAILYWVKEHIKYVAFENGYEGFIPRDALLVNQRRFGDCKDMASIITEMARYASIPKVNLCWIGTRGIPYSYYDIPTPAADNHMIATIQLNDSIIFLDGTDQETRFGLPSAFIQGKEALIQDGNQFKIVTVPIVSPPSNLREEKIQLTLHERALEGSGEIKLNGLNRSDFLSRIGDAAKLDRLELIKNFSKKGNNKFILTDYTEQNIKDKDLPYLLNYKFTLDNFVVNAKDEQYISLFLDKPFDNILMKKDRVSNYEFDFLAQNILTIELEIPSNKKVENLPENIQFSNDLLDYSIQYFKTTEKITLHFQVMNKKMVLDKNDFDLWNETIKKLKSYYSETITLTVNK